MRHSKALIFLVSLALCVCLASTALAEGPLTDLWNSGYDFLFRTDNVTVDGELNFSLDGEHFKTARLHYVQDGKKSFYGLKLLSPRKDGTERESGWTIIADEKGHYDVMEVYEPGVYRSGIGDAFHTLLRRSVNLDALTGLGSVLVQQLEPTLPEGIVKVAEQDGVKTVHIAVSENQIPDAALSFLNVAAMYLSDRWFSFGADYSYTENERTAFENYITVTQALTDGTVRWTLRDADMDFDLDAQNRLIGGQGKVTAASVFWDGTVREVEVFADFSVTDYGKSKVEPFDPADYGVVLPWEFYGDNTEMENAWESLDGADNEKWVARVKELLLKQNYPVMPETEFDGWTNGSVISVSIYNPDETEYYCYFSEDGTLLALQNLTSPCFSGNEEPVDQADADTVAEAKKLIRDFLSDVNPRLAESMETITLQGMLTTADGETYLTFSEGEQELAYFVICVDPALRVEYYTGSSPSQE